MAQSIGGRTMKITKEYLSKFSKEDLIKGVLRISNRYNGEYFVSCIFDSIMQENNKAKMKPLERDTIEAEGELKCFENSMCEKYGVSNFKDCLKNGVLNLEERIKYINLVKKHIDCLDNEMAEMDRQDKIRGIK